MLVKNFLFAVAASQIAAAFPSADVNDVDLGGDPIKVFAPDHFPNLDAVPQAADFAAAAVAFPVIPWPYKRNPDTIEGKVCSTTVNTNIQWCGPVMWDTTSGQYVSAIYKCMKSTQLWTSISMSVGGCYITSIGKPKYCTFVPERKGTCPF